MNRFATIFNNFESIHLTKDVGMIPAAFSKQNGFNKSILYYWDKNGNEIEEELPLLIIKPITSKNRFCFFLKLMKEIKRDHISIVNLYHDSIQTALLLIVFRVLNIKTYLKLDMDNIGFEALLKKKNSFRILERFRVNALNNATCISSETYDIFNKLKRHNLFNDKLIRVPNAILKDTIEVEPENFDNRENTIVIIGRIGAYQKNHELILRTLGEIKEFEHWNIKFIGPICNEFLAKIEMFYSDNPWYKKNIDFVGMKNRKEISEMYAKSKIFLLSSRYEGFSLALVEACYFGCYILSTDVGGAYEVTNKGQYGDIYKPEDLKSVLLNLNDDNMKDSYFERLAFGQKEFDIEKYIETLRQRLLE